MAQQHDEQFMRQALALAAEGVGFTAPNPMVGTIIVKNGCIIGSGFHERYGGPHAEVNAVNSATMSIIGATVYVTLEPCVHFGKTPPCADLLIAQKPARVVIGCLDPNPLVSGKGVQRLKEAGIAVTVGVLQRECYHLNRIFCHYMRTKYPYITMKTAMSLDGKIATHTRESRWISGEKTRADAHALRHMHTGIMVGVNTVLQDDPQLTCRMPGGKNPVRIVVDSRLRTPLTAKILQDQAQNRTILVTTKAEEKTAAVYQTAGATVLPCVETDGRVDLNDMIQQLGNMGIDSILLEGGATLNEAAVRAGIVQEVVTYLAPKLIGGADAPTPLGGLGIAHLSDACLLEGMQAEPLGEDLKITAYVKQRNEGGGMACLPGL